MYKCAKKIESKLVEKLLKYRIMCKDIPTSLDLDYRDASLTNIVVLRISIQKI